MMRIAMFLTLSLAIVILSGACAGTLPMDTPNLDGTSWVLSTIDETPPIEGTLPALEFEAGQVSGNAGCNRFGGAYKVKGDSIEFTDLYSTEMFCMDPEGAMEQEELYLDLLRNARRFELGGDRLIIFTGSDQTLTFQKPETIAESSPTPDPPEPTRDPTPVATFQPPAGFKEYRDPVAGVSVFIPESWHVTGVIEGEYAILQSYPEEKYVGGEARQPGDAKCDLNLRPPCESEAEILQAWESNERTTILSETEIALGSGQPATRFELDSMGRANIVIVRIRERIVLLTCFGDFTSFDQIAATLRESE
jgi:heat shock protein HslJ